MDGEIDLWDDTKIRSGENWKSIIRENLQQSRIVVCLISAHYLASEFIKSNELPHILKEAEDGGLTILSLIISNCSYSEHPILKKFQAINDPQKPYLGQSLANKTKILNNVYQRIREIVKSSPNIQTAHEYQAEQRDQTINKHETKILSKKSNQEFKNTPNVATRTLSFYVCKEILMLMPKYHHSLQKNGELIIESGYSYLGFCHASSWIRACEDEKYAIMFHGINKFAETIGYL